MNKQFEPLFDEIRVKVVQLLNLVDITPESIDMDEPLVGGRLGIDSIDVLELVMMMEKDYKITIDNKELGAKVFASLRSMTDYILSHSPEPAV